jgi:hypothetical protein
VRRARPFAAALVVALLVACASGGKAPREGAANAFDGQAFDTLLVAQAALEQAKAEVKTRDEALAVNKVIAAYNTAEASFRVYHHAATSGGNPSTVELAAQLAGVVADVAALVRLFHPPEIPEVEP